MNPKWLLLPGIALLLRWLNSTWKNNSSIPNADLTIIRLTNALTQHPQKQYGSRSLDQIKRIIIHHSATSSGSPEQYARYHVESNGWPGIGYHFVIQKDGTVFQTNELTTISYHTAGKNAEAIGICLTGNFDLEKPSIAQIRSTRYLIENLQRRFNHRLQLNGHRDYSTKSCPGNNLPLHLLNIA